MKNLIIFKSHLTRLRGLMSNFSRRSDVSQSSPSRLSVVTQSSLSRHSVVTQWSLSGHSVVTQSSLSRHSVVAQSSHSGRSVVTQWSLSRLSVVTQSSLSGLHRTELHRTLTMLLLLLCLGTRVVWGTNTELTFSLTSNPGSWPTTNSTTLTEYTYTLDGTSYTFALNNVKCNSGYLMLTPTAVLGLPAISDKSLTKVVVSNSSGCSTSTKVGISSSSSDASYITGGDIQTYSTTSSTYTYNLSGTSANTMYYLYVTNKNCQITSITLTYSGGGGGGDCDELTYSAIGLGIVQANSGGTYTNFSNVNITSDAVYAGNIMKFQLNSSPTNVIQLKSNGSTSGIVTTTSGGKAKSVTVTWNSSTADGRTLDIYGKNTAYSAASDLYSSSTQGTKLGSIVYNTSTELNITGDYTYIGLRSSSGAMYLTDITICWEEEDDCTSLGQINGPIMLAHILLRC